MKNKIRSNIIFIFTLLWILVPLSAEEFQEMTVGAGETLWAIANKYLKDPTKWPDIVRANNLQTSDPTIALPGTKLKIPITLIKDEYRNALLVSQIPEVRYKRKEESDWREAKTDLLLNYEDSLRTMDGAQARVRFPSKEIIQINANSYVVLRPEKILQEVQLLKGDLRASRAKVLMPQGTVVQPKSSRSDYQARVREDETEVVFVYRGKVDVTAKGQTVTVNEGFGTEVPKAAPPQVPQPLSTFKDFNPAELTTNAPASIDVSKGVVSVKPPAPREKEDKTDHQHSKTLVSKDILAQYRLQLSTEDKFKKIVLDKTLQTGTSFDLKQERIPDGTYFMRVAFIDTLGSQGPYSQPSQVDKDTIPPKILSLVPAEGQKFFGEESYCDVIGTVEGAAMVAVNDEILFISPTGRFNKFLSLTEGENKIKVLARDVAGNETLAVRTVTYSKAGIK